MQNNKLEKTFGKSGSIFGYLLIAAGIYVCFYSWIGFTTVFVGAFLAFSYNSVRIDFSAKRVKYSSNLFGIFSLGYWHHIKEGSSLEIKEPDSSGNKNPYHQIILRDENNKEIVILYKSDSIQNTENQLAELRGKLGL